MKKILGIVFVVWLCGVGTAQAAPANDMRAASSLLSVGITEGSNQGATSERHEVRHAGMTPRFSVWYRWVAPRNASVTLSTEGSSFDTVLGVYLDLDNSDSLGEITDNDNATFGETWSRVQWNAQEGSTYLVAVDGRSEGNFQLDFAISEPPPPPPPPPELTPFSCQYYDVPSYNSWQTRPQIEGSQFQKEVSFRRADREAGDPQYGLGRTLWLAWTAPQSGRLVLRSESVAYMDTKIDPVLAAYEVHSSGRNLLQWNDNWVASSSKAALVLEVRAGQEYAFLLDASYYHSVPCAKISGEIIASSETPDLPSLAPLWYAAPRGSIEVASRNNEARIFFEEREYSSYSCSLNNAPWQDCQSGQVLAGLPLGSHELRLRETRFGVQGQTSRTWRFAPRSIKIQGPRTTKKRKVLFRVRAFQEARCKIQGRAWRACSGRWLLRGLARGRYRLIAKQTVDGFRSRDTFWLRVK